MEDLPVKVQHRIVLYLLEEGFSCIPTLSLLSKHWRRMLHSEEFLSRVIPLFEDVGHLLKWKKASDSSYSKMRYLLLLCDLRPLAAASPAEFQEPADRNQWLMHRSLLPNRYLLRTAISGTLWSAGPSGFVPPKMEQKVNGRENDDVGLLRLDDRVCYTVKNHEILLEGKVVVQMEQSCAIYHAQFIQDVMWITSSEGLWKATLRSSGPAELQLTLVHACDGWKYSVPTDLMMLGSSGRLLVAMRGAVASIDCITGDAQYLGCQAPQQSSPSGVCTVVSPAASPRSPRRSLLSPRGRSSSSSPKSPRRTPRGSTSSAGSSPRSPVLALRLGGRGGSPRSPRVLMSPRVRDSDDPEHCVVC